MVNICKIGVDIKNSGHITNCYIVYDENNDGVVIDPGDEAEKIIEEIKNRKCNVKYIVITHAHADHMGALAKVHKETGAKIVVYINDLEALLDKQENYSEKFNIEKQGILEKDVLLVKDKDVLNVGNLKFEIIHTPGHTAGSMCILEVTNNKLFTGDTIFEDCYGRCDLYSGDFECMIESLRKIFNRFDDIMIYPGHGEEVNLTRAKKYIKMLLALKKRRL